MKVARILCVLGVLTAILLLSGPIMALAGNDVPWQSKPLSDTELQLVTVMGLCIFCPTDKVTISTGYGTPPPTVNWQPKPIIKTYTYTRKPIVSILSIPLGSDLEFE